MKILVVFGTRPEAIKMAPLCICLRERTGIDLRICLTAQHRGMLDTVMDGFSLSADYDLDIMTPGQSLCAVSSRVISGLEGVHADFGPELTLVHGDTATTLAASLASFYCGCKVGHVEAGLRTYNRYSPFPEEANRVLTGGLADIHFAPTITNADNLRRENIKENIFITGNTVIDALSHTIKSGYTFKNKEVAEAAKSGAKLVLLTAHRRENFGLPHEQIFKAVELFAKNHEDITIVYPVHPNPAVSERAGRLLGGRRNIVLTEPLETGDMHNLMARADFILTDSGGLQEEGPALGKPVLVLRTDTERPEAVKAGTVKLSGVETKDILEDMEELAQGGEVYRRMARAVNPYGDGRASQRIADAILHVYRGGPAPEEFRPE